MQHQEHKKVSEMTMTRERRVRLREKILKGHKNLSSFCKVADVKVSMLSQFLREKSKDMNAQNAVRVAHHVEGFDWTELAGVTPPEKKKA